MAEHVSTVLCQRVLQDTESKLLTFVDNYDRLIINPTPEMPDVEAKLDEIHGAGGEGIIVPAQIRLVMQWVRSDWSQPETSTCRLSIVDPLGEKTFEQEMSIELTEATLQRITVRSNQISVTVLGAYWFVVEKPTKGKTGRWTEVAKIPLHIVAAAKIEELKTSSTAPEQLSEPTPGAPRKSSSRRGRVRP